LRAVVTQDEDRFIVSASVGAPDEPPSLIGEEVVASLDAAHAYINQLLRQISALPDDVEVIYNIDGMPLDANRRH
jgi:hypothetical protein